ncbi:MAG TPA: DUF1080 domain-containing protein [Candidatus Glassbacteria bacterium]|nr:DUF1080 domain-containing protein [Candidatus Glassbacteria bacterium]
MKAFVRLTAATAALLFLVHAAQAQQGNAEGWVDLFNGRNLDGWVNVNCAPETFTVREGMIVCTGIPTGIMRTSRMYENYVLELDWRHMQKEGNAGLFVHSDALTAVGQPFSRSVEVQVMDGNAGDIFSIHGATMTPDKPHPEGWIRSFPAEDRMNPTGQWNHYQVISDRGTLSLAVNGKVVTRAYHTNPRKGYICLESEGSEVHFRNIRIKELPSTNVPEVVTARRDMGFHSLYTGLDLRNWRKVPGNEGHWVAKDWVLDYDGKSEASDQDGKSLTTEKEYRNFKLIVDWRLNAETTVDTVPVILPDGSYAKREDGSDLHIPVMDAGDSGIYLRGSSKAQINIWNWPCGSGEFYGYRLDEKMPASVRQGVTPLFFADNPIGRWNRFEITLIDENVTVVLNGKTVIDNAWLPDVPKRGPIALQHHGDHIQFANVYIKELPD